MDEKEGQKKGEDKIVLKIPPHLKKQFEETQRELVKIKEYLDPAMIKTLAEAKSIFADMEKWIDPATIEMIKKHSSVPQQPWRDYLMTMNPSLIRIDQNLASEFYNRLRLWIEEYESSLDSEHEVGARLVNFGQSIVFHLESIGYWNPSLISFSGTSETGEPVQLIQHVSQISVLLMKLPKKDPNLPKKVIGFSDEGPESNCGEEEINGEKSLDMEEKS